MKGILCNNVVVKPHPNEKTHCRRQKSPTMSSTRTMKCFWFLSPKPFPTCRRQKIIFALERKMFIQTVNDIVFSVCSWLYLQQMQSTSSFFKSSDKRIKYNYSVTSWAEYNFYGQTYLFLSLTFSANCDTYKKSGTCQWILYSDKNNFWLWIVCFIL